MFGKRDSGEEEKYVPKNSILDIWHTEYSNVSAVADQYLREANSSFTSIADESTGDVLGSLQDGQNTLNDLKSTFSDIQGEIEGLFVDSSDLIDDYGKLGFKLVFGVLALMNIALAVFVLFICLFSGKMCTNCCCCRCLFKFLTHLLWNILYLLMFITFMLGFLFAFIGTIGNDVMSVVSFIVSEDNLGEGKGNIIVDQLGEAKDYLNICINGNGSIIDLLNIDMSQLNSFDQILEIKNQINNTIQQFEDNKMFVTYSIYKDQLNARLNLSSEALCLIDETAQFEIPPSTSYMEDHKDQFLIFKAEISSLNGYIEASASLLLPDQKIERWDMHSNDQSNICSDTTDTIADHSKPFNPRVCKPLERDWINDITDSDEASKIYIKTEAEIITETLNLLHKAKTPVTGTTPKSFLQVLDSLKDVYEGYLDQYITALVHFRTILNNITGKLSQYTNEEAGIFSFINGKFIGLNLKVMLKYLKTALGKNVKTIGICLMVVGCSLALSISSTILLIVIINIAIDENKKQKKKEEEEENQINEYPQDSRGRVIKYKNQY